MGVDMNASSGSSPQPPRVVRGSLVTLRRRCGEPSCYCAQGERLHANPALSYSQDGETRIEALRDPDAPAVKAALERYRQRRDRLDEQATHGIETLRIWVAHRRERARR